MYHSFVSHSRNFYFSGLIPLTLKVIASLAQNIVRLDIKTNWAPLMCYSMMMELILSSIRCSTRSCCCRLASELYMSSLRCQFRKSITFVVNYPSILSYLLKMDASRSYVEDLVQMIRC